MDWIQVLVLFLANLALVVPLFIWNRTESRTDARHMDVKLEGQRQLILAVHKESSDLISAIHNEMKDFHKRLCEIEAKKGNQ